VGSGTAYLCITTRITCFRPSAANDMSYGLGGGFGIGLRLILRSLLSDAVSPKLFWTNRAWGPNLHCWHFVSTWHHNFSNALWLQ